jgi:hypothetical protein
VTIDVLSGATGTGSATREGLSMGGAGRWFPPFSCIMLMFWNELLRMIYYCVVMNVKSTMKCDWIIDEIGLLTNVKPIMECWLSYWLTSVSDIRNGRPGCDRWLASANCIRDG